MGISPQLSALEMLLYPKSALVIANTVLLAAGTIEIVPPEAPFTLFIWGAKRVLPVRLTSFTITEQAYDPSLNPIRATVNLGMQVLNYSDFPVSHPGLLHVPGPPGGQGDHGGDRQRGQYQRRGRWEHQPSVR